MSKEIREYINKLNELNRIYNEGIFDKFRKKEIKPTQPAFQMPEQPKRPQTFYDAFKNIENDENSYKLPIMFSLVHNGYNVNTKYGNPNINWFAFDVRSNHEIINLMHENQSFIRLINRENNEWRVAGLALDRNNPEVKKIENEDGGWDYGRYGYIFATTLNNQEVIDYILRTTDETNINKVLVNEGINSARPYFPEIKNIVAAIKIPKL